MCIRDRWADLAAWFWLGIILAGVIAALVPAEFLTHYLGGGVGSMLIMLAVGIPLYICASASTPIAAALILKGVSPGAALVFLLAGPATNGATITVMLKTLGKRAAAIYVLAIIICSLGLAWATDQLYLALHLDIRAVVSDVDELLPHWMGVAAAVVTLLLVARSFLRGHSHH
eukprot:TRINITY_DN8099_c0_g1_i1.p3 TRINITY_DN8099_c0_g1~~TRINITY_DN8099_c0_g1_i1.p3  ORF type:complete len:173 (-),score=61.97 TRINITY_DN8099_c0_g1_i1:99-617(-)